MGPNGFVNVPWSVSLWALLGLAMGVFSLLHESRDIASTTTASKTENRTLTPTSSSHLSLSIADRPLRAPPPPLLPPASFSTPLTPEMKHYEISGTTLSVALFTEVANSKELLELMQAGTLEPEVALLNASLIPDIFPVLAAAHKTLVSKSRDSLTTRTLHSELVYNYSGSKHISESLKRCGISDSTTYVLVARFGASDEELSAMKTLIKGKEIDLEELEGRSNKSQILKQYKITGVELGISTLGDAITCRIAARDAL